MVLLPSPLAGWPPAKPRPTRLSDEPQPVEHVLQDPNMVDHGGASSLKSVPRTVTVDRLSSFDPWYSSPHPIPSACCER